MQKVTYYLQPIYSPISIFTTGNWSCAQHLYLDLSIAYLPKTRETCWAQIAAISWASEVIPAALLKQEEHEETQPGCLRSQTPLLLQKHFYHGFAQHTIAQSTNKPDPHKPHQDLIALVLWHISFYIAFPQPYHQQLNQRQLLFAPFISDLSSFQLQSFKPKGRDKPANMSCGAKWIPMGGTCALSFPPHTAAAPPS